MSKSNEKTIVIITHLLGIFTSFLGALIVLLVSKDKVVKKHARIALNWQLTRLVYSGIALLLIIILVGFLLLAIISLLNIVFCVMAAVKAADGETWEYPYSIRFLKSK